MIINFLQSRTPPVLPALHQRPHMKLPSKNGVESDFADDLGALQGFGQKNKETLGQLLFCFFRFYGHEFDYEKLVISVRSGKQISKVEKGWHVSNNNRLCVEEPFNIGRNLGNTADDTSFRGLHMELRRAFDLISQAKLDECCEEFKFPKEEERVWERPPQKPKPILRSTSQASRGGRGGSHRGGGRHNNQHNRNGNNNRRASSAGGFDNGPGFLQGMSANMTAQDVWLQRQAQAQLHNDLYATYSVLQAQENNLRLQLYAQSLHNQTYSQMQGQGQTNSSILKQQTADRSRTSSFDQPPLTAPIRPDMYFYPLQYQSAPMYGYQTANTNPSSPSLSAAVPELRRSMHRSPVPNGTGVAGGQSNSSLRSHSQPAVRSGPSQLQAGSIGHSGLGIYQPFRQSSSLPVPPNFTTDDVETGFDSVSTSSVTTPPDEAAPKEYVGYYINDHAPSPARRDHYQTMVIPSFGDVNQNRRRLSTDQLPQSILDRLRRPSRSPSPLGHDRSYSTSGHSIPVSAGPSQSGTRLRTMNNQAPLVVNGTGSAPGSIPSWQAGVAEGSLPDDRGSDVMFGSVDSLSQVSANGSDASGDHDVSGQLTPRDPRADVPLDPPMVVNGSSAIRNEPVVSIVNGLPSHGINGTNILVPVESNSHLRLSPNTRNRLARQGQNGGVSPLDIGLSQAENGREEFPHLSPVYETRTPSPITNRKFEPVMSHKSNGFSSKAVDDRSGSLKQGSKLSGSNGSQLKPMPEVPKANGHTRASKSEGAGPGTWQKISKGKKKGPEPKSAINGQPLSEKPPTNDCERKGG